MAEERGKGIWKSGGGRIKQPFDSCHGHVEGHRCSLLQDYSRLLLLRMVYISVVSDSRGVKKRAVQTEREQGNQFFKEMKSTGSLTTTQLLFPDFI